MKRLVISAFAALVIHLAAFAVMPGFRQAAQHETLSGATPIAVTIYHKTPDPEPEPDPEPAPPSPEPIIEPDPEPVPKSAPGPDFEPFVEPVPQPPKEPPLETEPEMTVEKKAENKPVPHISALPKNKPQVTEEPVPDSVPQADPDPVKPAVPENDSVRKIKASQQADLETLAPLEPGVVKTQAVPLYKENPPPRYPGNAKRRGHSGTVMLKVFVTADGDPQNIVVDGSSGYDSLDRAALDAVRTWRFEPGKVDGVPRGMWVKIPVIFRLN